MLGHHTGPRRWSSLVFGRNGDDLRTPAQACIYLDERHRAVSTSRRQHATTRYNLSITMKKSKDVPSPTTALATVPASTSHAATSDQIDNINAAASMLAAATGLVAPIAGLFLTGLAALGTVVGARGMQKQVDSITGSVQDLTQRLAEADARVQQKLEREDVIEVVHEAIKDTVAASYASHRRRIADVLVNGLEQDADTRTLRMFEKAAASLDDAAIEVLDNLARPRPAGEFDEPQVRAYYDERRQLHNGPFGQAALADLVRHGLAHPEEIADSIEVSQESRVVGMSPPGMKGDIDRIPATISDAGRRFLAWARNEPHEHMSSKTAG